MDAADDKRFHILFRIKEVQKTTEIPTNECGVG